MPADRVEKLKYVLSQWQWTGYVTFKESCGQELRRLLPEYTNRLFAKSLYEHIRDTGDLQEVAQRPEDGWETKFFYASKPTIDGVQLYVKLVFLDEDEDDRDKCIAVIVSLHPPTF